MTDEREQQPTEEEEQSLEEAVSQVLELPMVILALVMTILLIAELALPLAPGTRRIVILAGSIIWWIFIAEYAVRVFLAENRLRYVKRHWADALFIFVPFLRVFRVVRAVQAVRFLRAVRPAAVGRTYVTTRRSLRQLGAVLGKRSFPYVVAVTVIVNLIGALIVFLLERTAPGSVIRSYGSAVWWTVGIVTTVGSELHPITAEGRLFATLLMIYGVGVFGYVAATLASYFVGQDAGTQQEASGMTVDQDRELQEISERVNELLAAQRREREQRRQ